MAVGFTLYFNRNGWKDINNPKFVFTSPNMNDQSPAGTRSHIVAGEVNVGTWIEDQIRNKMHKIACAQDESMEYPATVNVYDYDDYRANRVKVAEKAISPFNKIYLSERPSAVQGQWFPNPTISGKRFEATSITPAVDSWWKLNEEGSSYPDFSDFIGSFSLVSSGGVVPVYYPPFEFYAPEFNGDVDSLIYSNVGFSLDGDFCFSFYVDNYGAVSSGIDSFGYNSTFINVVTSGTYFSVGCSKNNTITYSIKTDVAEYKSDTGSTVSSGVFNHIVVSYDQNSGFYLYKNNSLLLHNSMVSGTIGSGNICIGNTSFGYTSTFRGCINDIKYWNSYLCFDDVNEIGLIDQLDSYPICMFGSSVGDYIVDVSPDPVEINKGLFYGFPIYKEDCHFSDTLHLFMKFGEAYNCYVTAWDDATHSSVLNTVLKNELCKLSACVYRSPDSGGWPSQDQQNTTINPVYDYVSDFPIKGNELYYGKFNLVYYVKEPNIVGDMLSIRPRISTINSSIFDPGNYDFVITFHYQYT